MVRFPHIATVAVRGAATKAVNGDLVPGAVTTRDFTCRAEPSGGNGYVVGAGGTKIHFTWLVFCAGSVTGLQPGTQITITDAKGVKICTDTVKRFSQGQFNSRIWL